MNRLILASMCLTVCLCTPLFSRAEYLEIDFSGYAPDREVPLDTKDFIDAYVSPEGLIESVSVCDNIWSGASYLTYKGVYFRPEQGAPAVLTLNLNPDRSVKTTSVKFRIWAYNAMNTSTDAVTQISGAINGREFPLTEVNGLSNKGKPVLANIGIDTPEKELCRSITLRLPYPAKTYSDFQMCLERIYIVYEPDDNPELSVDGVTIQSEAAESILYDLHGRVINSETPAAGIYIRRTGEGSSKIIVR